MRSFHKILLTSAAALSLTTAVSFAQDSESSNVLNDAVGGVTDTVNGTVDAVNGTVDSTVDGVNSTVDGVSSSVTGATNSGDVGGDAAGSVGDVASVGDAANFSDVLSMIEAGNTDLSDISDVSNVSVVDVADVANFDANALNDALNGNASNITALQDAINGNEALTGFLSGNAIDVSDVVAINNNQDGSLVFYTNSQD